MKQRNRFVVMARLIGMVRPLLWFMSAAILMGLAGHLCAASITIFGGYAALGLFGLQVPLGLPAIFVSAAIFALLRRVLRYGEQTCNHYIAFKLLALIRDHVFQALRRLCPAKLESKDKGDLISISVITSGIELLEVFYAHTISPAAIALLFTIIMCLFIGSFHFSLGLLALLAYSAVGIMLPLLTDKSSGKAGMEFRTKSGDLSSFVLDSLRGLPEIIQYGCGQSRLEEINAKTDALSEENWRMKRTAGHNMTLANTLILIFDLAMLLASSALYRSGAVDFSGVLIPAVALMSSFGPCVALANLGSTLQSTFAARNRVLDILEETPSVGEV